MDLPQIGYFLVLARLLNFTRASEECRITQPAFSRAVRRLELELGGDLLLRERSLTQLTDFGRAMLPLLEQIAVAADTARAEARQYRAQEGAPLRLGLSPWLSLPLVNPILSEVFHMVKRIEFSVTIDKEKVLRERMLQGELDVLIGIQGDIPPSRFNQWRLFTAKTAIFFRREHPLAANEAFDILDLAEATLLGAFEPDALPEILIAQITRVIGRRPRSPHRAGNWETSLQLASAGFGIGLGLACWTVPKDLVALPLPTSVIDRDVVLETLSGRPKSAAATAFVKLARSCSWP